MFFRTSGSTSPMRRMFTLLLEAFVRCAASRYSFESALVLSRERPATATVLLMMREEHHPSSVPRRAARRFVFTDLPSSFFLPRYLRLPDICTRRADEAALERRQAHTCTPHLLCSGECETSAHRGVTQPHDSPIR